jgi:hypothetical protein
MIVVIRHGDSVVDQVSGWTSVCQSPDVCCNNFDFLSRAHLLGEVCATSGCRQSWPLLKWKNVLGDVSFKIVKIFLLFANTGMNSANIVSSARWRDLRGLSLWPLHILWSVWHTFLLTIHCASRNCTIVSCASQSYLLSHVMFPS